MKKNRDTVEKNSENRKEKPEENNCDNIADKDNLDSSSREDLMNDLLDLLKEKNDLLTSLETLENERDECKEEAARSRAEMYNFRQRMEKEMKKQKRIASESAILDFLPVLDNLERAVSTEEVSDLSHLIKGVEMVHRQFIEVLSSLGAEAIPAEGEPFSPAVHEAVFVVEVDSPELDGMVTREIQKGFKLADKVIRPSRVEVGRYTDDFSASRNCR